MEAWESLLRRPLATTGRAREAPAGSRRGRVSGAASVVAFAGHLSGDAAVSRAAAVKGTPPGPRRSAGALPMDENHGMLVTFVFPNLPMLMNPLKQILAPDHDPHLHQPKLC
nr:uncharacterized protein LOC113814013 [Penaeus vannamei]